MTIAESGYVSASIDEARCNAAAMCRRIAIQRLCRVDPFPWTPGVIGRFVPRITSRALSGFKFPTSPRVHFIVGPCVREGRSTDIRRGPISLSASAHTSAAPGAATATLALRAAAYPSTPLLFERIFIRSQSQFAVRTNTDEFGGHRSHACGRRARDRAGRDSRGSLARLPPRRGRGTEGRAARRQRALVR